MNEKVAALIDMGISRQCAVEMVALSMNCRADEKDRRVPCEVYSRVVGYLRPVEQWNIGKREEFRQRKEYAMKASCGCL